VSTTTHPMTGLRRVILDAIQGVSPTIRQAREFTAHGLMKDYGIHSEAYFWVDDALSALPTDDLMAIYDNLRPGVLENMGKGE
jgi:hypothetical protein